MNNQQKFCIKKIPRYVHFGILVGIFLSFSSQSTILGEDPILAKQILYLFNDFKKFHKNVSAKYFGFETPDTLSHVVVDLPFQEIKSIYEKYHIIQLRKLTDKRLLIVGCGNGACYSSIFDTCHDTNENAWLFVLRSHAHEDAITIDVNLYMNPYLVAPWGSAFLLEFFRDKNIFFERIFFEGSNPSSKTYLDISQILKPDGLVERDFCRFYFSSAINPVHGTYELSWSDFKDLQDLQEDFVMDLNRVTDNEYYIGKTKPYLVKAHKQWMRMPKINRTHDYFHSPNFHDITFERVHILKESSVQIQIFFEKCAELLRASTNSL